MSAYLARDTLRCAPGRSAGDNGPVLIRPRRDADWQALGDLVRLVHAADRYPRYLPGDLGKFLAPADPYGCWVAEAEGRIVGHVALVPRTLPAAMELAAAVLGCPEGQLAVVARLFVSPAARGTGAGRRLLATAVAAAAGRGLYPVLDVDTELAAAIALYESAGWTRAGTVAVRWSDDRALDEHVYLGPAGHHEPASSQG